MTEAEASPDFADEPQHVRMLRAIRKQRHWSQRELGKQLGDVSARTVMRWENGQREPRAYVMAALREMLDDAEADASLES